MRRLLVVGVIATIQLATVGSASHASSISHPDLSGTWATIDCAQWWEGGEPIDCDRWGDSSTLRLKIEDGPRPFVRLYDSDAVTCGSGYRRHRIAFGRAGYVHDNPDVSLRINFKDVGCGDANDAFTMELYWDPGSDTMWVDPDGDGWGLTWHRRTCHER